jgi:cytidine deaminase
MNDPDKIIAALLPRARAASENAYSPFSGARVGACVMDQTGNVYAGCNVENASYGLTQCAERNALATAISAGMQAGTAQALLIYATGFEALAPCGACRQVMKELLAENAVVISCQSETEFRSWSIEELLPDPFVLG